MYIEREGKEQRLQEQIPKKRGAIQEKKSKARGKKKSQNTTTHGNDPKK